MDERQSGDSKVLYDYMLAAHKDQFGEPSVKMRHYLQGLAEELATRMGLTRTVVSPVRGLSNHRHERSCRREMGRGQAGQPDLPHTRRPAHPDPTMARSTDHQVQPAAHSEGVALIRGVMVP